MTRRSSTRTAMTNRDRDDLGRRQRRGFGLADVLILITSTAVALAWLRKPLEPRLSFLADGRIILNLRPLTIVGAAFAATWGVGVLAMRLRPQQRSGNDWRTRPGFVGCAAATLVALIKLATLLIWGAFRRLPIRGLVRPLDTRPTDRSSCDGRRRALGLPCGSQAPGIARRPSLTISASPLEPCGSC